MSYILNIETATTNCSVSLAKDGNLISFKEDTNPGYSHAESLHGFIEDVLHNAGIGKNKLSAIAISEGPGSYTGLRIGTSTAKGLCYALDIPLVATSTLLALAKQISIKSGYIIPMLDARRQEVYAAVYTADYECVESIHAKILQQDSFHKYLSEREVYFLGNANRKTSGIISHNNANFIEESLPSAKEMASLSYQKYESQEFADVAYFEPLYLKEFLGTKK